MPPSYSRRVAMAAVGVAAFVSTRAAAFAAPRAPPAGGLRGPASGAVGAVGAAGRAPGAAGSAAAGGRAAGAAPVCGAAAALALGGLAAARQRRRARASACAANAFGSGSSSFMGAQTATSYALSAPQDYDRAPVDEHYSYRHGAASMGMMEKARLEFLSPSGYNGRHGEIFAAERREMRRRGEELYMHDVDNFELTYFNLVPAPGAIKKRVVRGRGKYQGGKRGNAAGMPSKGPKQRTGRPYPRGFDAAQAPINITTPKLYPEQKALMKNPYTSINLGHLDQVADGEEVDYHDLVRIGIKVPPCTVFKRFKVQGSMDDEFTTKNLTVYAHFFEPAARDKIESLGGKCVRLHDYTHLPLDEDAVAVNVKTDDSRMFVPLPDLDDDGDEGEAPAEAA